MRRHCHSHLWAQDLAQWWFLVGLNQHVLKSNYLHQPEDLTSFLKAAELMGRWSLKNRKWSVVRHSILEGSVQLSHMKQWLSSSEGKLVYKRKTPLWKAKACLSTVAERFQAYEQGRASLNKLEVSDHLGSGLPPGQSYSYCTSGVGGGLHKNHLHCQPSLPLLPHVFHTALALQGRMDLNSNGWGNSWGEERPVLQFFPSHRLPQSFFFYLFIF